MFIAPISTEKNTCRREYLGRSPEFFDVVLFRNLADEEIFAVLVVYYCYERIVKYKNVAKFKLRNKGRRVLLFRNLNLLGNIIPPFPPKKRLINF
jgi:hypothetical protein